MEAARLTSGADNNRLRAEEARAFTDTFPFYKIIDSSRDDRVGKLLGNKAFYVRILDAKAPPARNKSAKSLVAKASLTLVTDV
jgi:hypothetical protein